MEKKHIQIAVCVPLTGLSFKLGTEMKQAIELAVNEKNKNGGISGTPVKLLVFDDQSKVKLAEEAARELCKEENLLGVIGHYGSDTSLAAAKIYHIRHIPLLSPIASNPLLTSSGLSNVFRYTNRDDQTVKAISNYLYKKLKKRRAVVINSSTAYGNSMAEEFKKEFARCGGHILNTLEVKEGEKDFNLLMGQLPKYFDLVFYGGTFEGAPLLEALRAARYNQLMATGDGCWDMVNFLEPAKDVVETGEGVLVLAASAAIGDVPGSLDFAKKYKLQYGLVINYALNAYDAACLLLAAIEKAAQEHQGPPDSKKVLAALRSTPFKGIANPNAVVWDDYGDNQGAITKLNIVKNGKFKEIAHVDAKLSSEL